MKSQEEINRWIDAYSNGNQIMRYNSSKPKVSKIREYFIDQIDDYGWTMFIIVWLFKIVVVSIFALLVLWVIDSSFLPNQKAEGIVIEKYYRPAYTYYQTMHTGKNSSMTYPVHVDESYNMVIEINGLSDRVRTYAYEYHNVPIGKHYMCIYTKGRIFNTIYIQSYYENK